MTAATFERRARARQARREARRRREEALECAYLALALASTWALFWVTGILLSEGIIPW